MKYLSFLIMFIFTSCGIGPDTDKSRDGNRGPTFNTTVCGDISKPSFNGLMTGQFYTVSNSQGTYMIRPQNEYVSNSLNNLETFTDICLYSQKEISTTSEGSSIMAEQIKIRVDGQTL